MKTIKLIGIYGGTFDPVHNGHIFSVNSVIDELSLESAYLLPSSTPPHRSQAKSSALHRFNMVKLATREHPKLIADDRECRCNGKSYTINTLKSFRAQMPTDSLAFIVGMDAYDNLKSWKDWQNYLDYTHIIVMQRPGYEITPVFADKLIIPNSDKLKSQIKGNVYFAKSTLHDISSTNIREKLRLKKEVHLELPPSVKNYIKQHHLYANSSTT